MILGWGVGDIWIIFLDARQGYHRVSVRKADRKKLAFLLLMTESIILM